jgi:ribosomal subunit interface protein
LEISISSRHTVVTESLREATRSKISRLERYGPEFHRAEVHFTEEKNPRVSEPEVCEVRLTSQRGGRLRCKASGPDGFIAIDRAVGKLENQMARRKARVTQERVHARA